MPQGGSGCGTSIHCTSIKSATFLIQGGTLTDNEILGSLIAVTATIFGLVTGIQALARAKATNEMEHKMVLQKLERILQHNAEILDNLDDVLKHPDDTHFSVSDLHREIREELAEIKSLLRRLQNELR